MSSGGTGVGEYGDDDQISCPHCTMFNVIGVTTCYICGLSLYS